MTPRALLARTWTATALTALATGLVPFFGRAARSGLGLSLQPSSGSVDEAAHLFVHNLQPATALILLARIRCTSTLRCVMLAANAAPTAAAIGGYGTALTAWSTHIPVELAALALAAADNPTRARTVAVVALLTLAACLESTMPSVLITR